MTDSKFYPELFEQTEARFKKHLELSNNERIIFSGKFGHGKTTFLKYFFEDERQKKVFERDNKKYNIISLFPVNYSVATNEDIFRYIKYDIILELLSKNVQIEEHIKNYLETLPEFLKKNVHKVLAAIVHMVPKIGKDVVESFDKWDKLKEEFFAFHDSKKGNSKGKTLIDYIEHFEQTEGSIFEDDIVTKLIEKILSAQKQEMQAEETILIIDDLDRIDPEHIFRLLNVFSAHFDRRNVTQSKNKFGFDKVIVVCDIDNIRQIFKSKFGIKVDFNGYIDKFYSKWVFEYDCSNAIDNIIRYLIRNTRWYDANNRFNNSKGFVHQGETFRLFNYQPSTFLFDVLSELFLNKQLDLRNITKLHNEQYDFSNFVKINHRNFDLLDYPVLFYLMFLNKIKGGYIGLKEAIDTLILNSIPQPNFKYYSELIIFTLVDVESDSRIVEGKEYGLSLDTKLLTIKVLDNHSAINPNIMIQIHTDLGLRSYSINHTDFVLILNNLVDLMYNKRLLI